VRVKTWVWVVAGIAVLTIVAFLTVIGLGVYVALHNVQVSPATAASAEQEFASARERFKDQPPLILIDEDGHVKSSAPAGTSTGSRPTPLQSLHVMAWDPGADKLVHAKVPFWVLRLTHHGARLRFGTDEIDLEHLHLTIEDVEHHGPGLILDHRDRSGSHVLLWAE
jgi:hypothetical protein